MLNKYAAMTGAEVKAVEWLGNEFPVIDFINQVDDATSVIAIVSPNNPTGQVIGEPELSAIAETFPNRLVLLDQAYAEFENDAEKLTNIALSKYPNVVVIRSLSKAWGLAGIRVGYALGSSDVITNLRKVGGPYTVPQISLAIAEAALQQRPNQSIAKIRKERVQLAQLLDECGCKTISSQANFVLAIFDESPFDAGFVFRSLSAQGILVRMFEDLNALRITCPGDESAFKSLCATLRRILCPEAILFDMDGVLVDEGPSYRESIRQTCKFFGESFTSDEIADLKLCGDANNDWIFTHRILTQRGCKLEYEDVKSRFELFLQGDEHTPGLWNREIQLVNTGWLKSIAARYPLGIVTGRPRNDAIRFLKNAGIDELFSAIVCMEDGPRKPNPSNVRTAMRQLRVDSAWMIGDTPDDINAAHAAGIASVGIAAPQDDSVLATRRLLEAGASTVVANLQQLGEVLP